MNSTNPLEQPAPQEPLQRIQVLARDLAYGAVNGIWGSKIYVMFSASGERWASDTKHTGGEVDVFFKYLKEKWNNLQPPASLMLSFEYFAIYNAAKQHQVDYLLTAKAFALLEKPATSPSVFISYKQDESSALGLLIEARLKYVDRHISVFIDKLLLPGEDWERRLEETIRSCRYFICLIGPDTLSSTTIQKELNWAIDSGCTIVSICHNGYEVNGDYPEKLRGKQAIIINRESAKDYESALSDVLVSLGYSTLG